jgi:signal transduction histidine kinase
LIARALAWLRSLHAKLFIVTGLVTSVLTLAVAWSITRNSQRELENYSRKLVIEVAQNVATEISERDPSFRQPRMMNDMLEGMASTDRAIFQIDVFQRSGPKQAFLWVSSELDESTVKYGPEVGTYLDITAPDANIVELENGSRAWKVYVPIPNPNSNRISLGIVRAYCDLQRWDDVWSANRRRTLDKLPGVLVGEFILLWLLLRWLISDPLSSLVETMERIERGEVEARAEIQRRDELGYLATRFNIMAGRLQRASKEREALLEEVRGLNAGLEHRIEEARQELQAKNDALAQQERLAIAGQLAATFAHEVGTPLNLVNGHLQLLQDQPDLPDKAKERLGLIHAQIRRVGDIVRRLLDMTRRPQAARQTLHLRAFLLELQQLWVPTLSAHDAKLEMEIPEDCLLQADRKQMEQLFLNLMNNALDALPDQGGIVRITAERMDEGWWRVRFMDTGTGIPEEALPQIFKPMFTTKPEGKGTGLGLPICREIIRAHGGEIRAENNPDRGAAMVFTLPGA